MNIKDKIKTDKNYVKYSPDCAIDLVKQILETELGL